MDNFDYGFILVIIFSIFQTYLVCYLVNRFDFYFIFVIWIISFGLSFICFIVLIMEIALNEVN